MLTINSIFESYPNNPETIILKNEYYPSGLTQLDVYEYYINNKLNILKAVKNREVMFFLQTNNDIIIKRKINNNFIRLNNSNYEKFITGRTLSIHSTINKRDNIGIIDIDSDNFDEAKKVTGEVFDYLSRIFIGDTLQIRFTGKTSFHIVKYFDRQKSVANIKSLLFDRLSEKFNGIYNLTQKTIYPKIDLSSNKFHGGFITLNSLSILGLKCMEIKRNQLNSFNKRFAKIT